MNHLPVPIAGKESGAALIVALVMLVVVTLIAVSAAQFATLDERGARASRDREVALQAAEAALKDAARDIEAGYRTALIYQPLNNFEQDCPNVSLPTSATDAATNRRGLCIGAEPTASRQLWQDINLSARAVPFGTFTGQTWTTPLAPAPVYFIETVPFAVSEEEVQGTSDQRTRLAFRITAVGFGPSGSNIEVALQTFFVKTL